MIKIQASEQPLIAQATLRLMAIITSFSSYYPLSIVLFFCFAAVMIILINSPLVLADSSFEGEFEKLLSNSNISTKISLDEQDFLDYTMRYSFYFSILATLISSLVKALGVKLTPWPFKKKYLVNLLIISSLMILALISLFIPSAKNNSTSIWPLIPIFWVLSIILFTTYALLNRLANFFTKFQAT